ncbi:MAG: TetR/AcrR family transcriptional regulator [Desulfobacterales bacterium]
MQRPKKRLPAEERKKQILKSAVTVFAKSNYRSAKVVDIADEVAISEAMVYKYFPTKKSIFLAILAHMSARIIAFWKEEVKKEPDALTALKKMGLVYYERMKEHPNELKVQFQAISEIDDEDIARQLRKDHLKYIGFINSVLKKGVRQGIVKQNLNTEELSFLMNGGGIVLNMMQLLSFDITSFKTNPELLLDHFIEMIRA